jgi:hypothetical protein
MMASDFAAAGVVVGHNVYVLRSVVEDLIKGYYSNAHEHRYVEASKVEIEQASDCLRLLVASLNGADTSRTVEAAE